MKIKQNFIYEKRLGFRCCRNRAKGQSSKDLRADPSDLCLSTNLLTESYLAVVPRIVEIVPAHVGLIDEAEEKRPIEAAIAVPDDISPSVEQLASSPGLERFGERGPIVLHIGQLSKAEVTMNSISLGDRIEVANFVFTGLVARDKCRENVMTCGPRVVTKLVRVEPSGSRQGHKVHALSATNVTLENSAFRPVREFWLRETSSCDDRIGTTLVGADEFGSEATDALWIAEENLQAIFVEISRLQLGQEQCIELIFLILGCHCVCEDTKFSQSSTSFAQVHTQGVRLYER